MEMIRQFKVAHDTAIKARTATMVTLKVMLVHVPEQLREETAGKFRSPWLVTAPLCNRANWSIPMTQFGTCCSRLPGGGSTSMTNSKTSAVSSLSLSTLEHHN
nr:hypothetical protein [Brevibacterium renqingii]